MEKIEEWELGYTMEDAKNKKARDRAFSLYKWNEAGERELRDIKEYAKDKKARDKAEQELSKRYKR